MPTPKDVYDFFLFKINLKQRLESIIKKRYPESQETLMIIDTFWQEYNRIIVHFTVYDEHRNVLYRDCAKLDILDDICEGWTDD